MVIIPILTNCKINITIEIMQYNHNFFFKYSHNLRALKKNNKILQNSNQWNVDIRTLDMTCFVAVLIVLLIFRFFVRRRKFLKHEKKKPCIKYYVVMYVINKIIYVCYQNSLKNFKH